MPDTGAGGSLSSDLAASGSGGRIGHGGSFIFLRLFHYVSHILITEIIHSTISEKKFKDAMLYIFCVL